MSIPNTWASLLPALPEIYLTAAVCVLLLVDVFVGEKRRWGLYRVRPPA